MPSWNAWSLQRTGSCITWCLQGASKIYLSAWACAAMHWGCCCLCVAAGEQSCIVFACMHETLRIVWRLLSVMVRLVLWLLIRLKGCICCILQNFVIAFGHQNDHVGADSRVCSVPCACKPYMESGRTSWLALELNLMCGAVGSCKQKRVRCYP